jgi:hypothetical protein
MRACRPAILAASQGCCILSFYMNTQRQLCIFALRRSFGRVKIIIARQLGARGYPGFTLGVLYCSAHRQSKEGSSEVGDIRLIWVRMPAAGRVSKGESTVHILSHYCVPNSRDRKSTSNYAQGHVHNLELPLPAAKTLVLDALMPC